MSLKLTNYHYQCLYYIYKFCIVYHVYLFMDYILWSLVSPWIYFLDNKPKLEAKVGLCLIVFAQLDALICFLETGLHLLLGDTRLQYNRFWGVGRR